MKNIFYLLIFPLVIACSSVKNIEKKCSQYPFEELDSIEQTLRKVNYKISVPENWTSYSKGSIALYLKKDFNDSLSYYYNNLARININSFKLKETCVDFYDIDKFLTYWLHSVNRYNHHEFKYVLLKTNHIKYGKGYIIKHRRRLKGKIYSTSELLLFHKNYGYSFRFSAEVEMFETYLNVFEETINSFTVIN